MPTRTAHARWEGNVKTDRVRSTSATGCSKATTRSSHGSRRALAPTPKSCWARPTRAVSPWRVADFESRASHVNFRPQGGGFKITKSHIVCEAKVPGIDRTAFVNCAEGAKAGCHVSQALAGIEITLEAKLAD